MTRRDALRFLGTAAAGIACGVRPTFAASAPAPATSAAPAMHSRRIPSSGETLPVIGLGTWQTFDVADSTAARQPLEDVLAAFVELGGRLIDSSPMYGRSEEVVGELAEKLSLRQQLFIATKVWTTGRRAGIEQMEDSVRKLRADPIDLMQVHNLVDATTHLETLREWKRSGRVRHIGVTHYTSGGQDAVADLIAAEAVDFIQINYSIGERTAERRLLPLAADRGVAVIVNRPFAGGGLFRRLRTRPLPAWAAEIECDSWAQLMLKFIVSHPSVTCAIPATSKAAHLRDNMKAGVGPLPDATLRARIAAEAS
jgi:aryl-alcohol dehydrogenase-like predicted oxidoreductase